MDTILSVSAAGIVFIVLGIAIIIGCAVFYFVYFPVSVWWKAKISKAPVPMSKLVAMKMRKTDLTVVVCAYITAIRAGLNVKIDDIETHVLAGGDIDNVIKAMISAKNAVVMLSVQTAMAIDLAGKNVYSIVQSCIVPKIVETPVVTAVSKDGVEIKSRATVTIKANMGRVLGGADEGTIISRVSEALSSVIGSSVSHTAVLENPDVISDCILAKGLDAETAYEIISVDIFDVQIGKNIAVQLKLDQGEIERRANQSKLEERRLEAVAAEQENKAKIQEAKIKQIEAEMEVPKALANALKEGKISPMDYYDIQNLEADTKLKNVLSGNEKPGDKGGQAARTRKNPFDF